MKKIFVLFILSLFIFSIDASATFTIETDLIEIYFGSMSPGEIREGIPTQGITVRCTTDQGNPWFLRIRTENPFGNMNNLSAIIPNENFWCYADSTTGSGILVTTEQDFSVERIVYTASAGEGAQGVGVVLKFKLAVPTNTQSGDYSTRVILTMIE